ncbi:hypothetical protein NIES4072_25950 [Nostoc commune NIES-4072]|uniref:Uncharacterized protein n=1 Tax=Nostoc commune NIES-4072 TaxID=2005467 RepID=A0A2R5FJL4_NOSCO|nr:hypothetical protein [Nostoc commune]BBD63749.1 hypothetical protein NIES4070_00910 [Nostoc commune HK-02]GBG18930.1 hypothetical protein NIES4072_25950 [Nostoc commune NIES-4072]
MTRGRSQYCSGKAFLTRHWFWGKGYWVWVKGFFFPFSPKPDKYWGGSVLRRLLLNLKILVSNHCPHKVMAGRAVQTADGRLTFQ